jgi:mono/diheme cytochrome c family protein
VVRAYGKVYELDGLENPLRALEKEDPAAFKELAREGGEVYFRNCFFCHGARLDGRGHYAYAMDPLPMPFTGSDTIAQLKESYLFWRIVKGGPGLPREGGPNISSMPAWEDELTEEEVWKVILFLYDYTGNRPRSWKD